MKPIANKELHLPATKSKEARVNGQWVVGNAVVTARVVHHRRLTKGTKGSIGKFACQRKSKVI